MKMPVLIIARWITFLRCELLTGVYTFFLLTLFLTRPTFQRAYFLAGTWEISQELSAFNELASTFRFFKKPGTEVNRYLIAVPVKTGIECSVHQVRDIILGARGRYGSSLERWLNVRILLMNASVMYDLTVRTWIWRCVPCP